MTQMSQFLANHSGFVLFLAIFAEQIGLPLPAAPLLVAAGALAADGALSPATAIGITLVACVLADLMWFHVGRRGGDNVLRFLCRRDSSCFGRNERFFAKYGTSALVAAKFFPGLSLLLPPLAGAFGIGVGKFLWLDALGSLLYAVFYLGMGFLFSHEVNGMLDLLNGLGVGTAALASASIVIFLAYKYAQRRKMLKPSPATPSKVLATIAGT